MSLLISTELLLFAASLAVAVLLAAGTGLGLAWLLRKRPAPLRYGLMLAALSVALLSPLLTLLAQQARLGYVEVEPPRMQVVAAIATAADTADAALDIAPVAVAAPRPPLPWWRIVGSSLCIIWLAGIAVQIIRVGLGIVHLRRFMLTLRPCEDPAAGAALRRATEALALGRVPGLRVSDVLPVPLVIGPRRPLVVLPSQLLRVISAEKLEAVLLHEVAHIAHGDLWIGLLQRLAGVLLWWCPLVHWLNARISEVREDICDNYVLEAQGDGLRLAEVLVDLAERAAQAPWKLAIGAMGAIDETGGLEGRIQRLLQQRRSTMTRMNFAALLGTLAFSLLIGTGVLVTTIRAADALPPEDNVLSARDFWDKTGSQSKHEFDEKTIAMIRKTAADSTAEPALRLRATKIACDLAGNSRINDRINAETRASATAAAFKHLEANLADETVRKFSPELGITHMTFSPRAGDADGIWVLIESLEPERTSGLNIRVDPKTGKVTKIDHWGKVRANGAPFVATITVSIKDDRHDGKIETRLAGNTAEPLKTQVGGVGTSRIEATITAVEKENPRQYVGEFRIIDGDTVLSAPKVTTLLDQLATIQIGDNQGNGITIDFKVTENLKPDAENAAAKRKLEMARLELEVKRAADDVARLKTLHAAGVVGAAEMEAAQLRLVKAEAALRLVGADASARRKIELQVKEAELRDAAVQLDRIRKLVEAGVAAREELDKAELAARLAELELKKVEAGAAERRKLDAEMVQAKLRTAALELQRLRKMHEAGRVSQEELRQAEDRVRRLEQDLKPE